MALRAIHGNRVEALLDALIEALPPADPFEPTTIVVGSHLVARWLVRELALRRGIAAGIETPTFDRFLERTWAGDDDARAANLTALDRRQLAAAIASTLADEDFLAAHPTLERYMRASPPGDRAGPRRVQLAEQVATLAWNYALTRPDWMPALVAGRAPGELEADRGAAWQAALIGEALRRAGCGEKTCALVPTLPWARRRAGLPTPVLPRGIAVFGVSYLLRAQLEALTDLSATTDVTVLLLDPCAELWDDVSGRSKAESAQAAGDPLLLTLWGRAVRDTLGALVERTSGDIDDAFVDEPARTVREQLMRDVLHRDSTVAALPADTGHGVRVLACPDPRREIEIVAAEIRRRLDADPTLLARDIGVWVAAPGRTAERYLAQAPAAFAAVGVPWHLIDAPIDDRGRIGEAVLSLLELPTSAMTRRDLLRVMTHPAVLANHPNVDPADWVRWTEKLGIVHGADHDAHKNTYLVDHPGRFHWDQGVRRLALGAFMLGGAETLARGPAKIGTLEVAPEEIRPEKHASAATYALLVRSLCADMAWLATHEATLSEWATIFVQLVDAYLARRGDEGARDVERVRAWLAGIAHVDLDGRKVGFREAREHAVRRLVDARRDSGEALAAGVMVAPLGAMRAVPFRVAFVVGLDEGAFPAGDQPSPLDLRREPRPGDVSPRDRDRHAFLEVLLGARDALYLSYVAVEAKSGQALGPSSVVLELADALAPYLGAPSSKIALEQLTTRHPLHRWSPVPIAGAVGPAAGPATGHGQARTDTADTHVGANAAHTHVGATTVHPHASTHTAGRDAGANTAHTHVGANAAHTHVGANTAHTHVGANTSHTHVGANTGHADVRETPLPPTIVRESWAIRVRDALRGHLRAAGHPVPDEDGMLALLAHPSPTLDTLRAALGIVAIAKDGSTHSAGSARAAATGAPTRPLTIGNIRAFLESPVQAWAQAVLGLDEVPDDEVVEHIDEPFHVERPARALLLREVLAAQLRDPSADPEERYITTVRDMELRGQFPVGVFGDSARASDLRLLALWRSKLGPIALGSVTRLAFGRSTSPAAELLPAIDIPLSGGRTVRLIGQTEVLVRLEGTATHGSGTDSGARYKSIIPLLGDARPKSRYHLRGALDALVLAAAGIATHGHEHMLVDGSGVTRSVTHAAWSQETAREYLAGLITELLDEPHGYVLPFDNLVAALAGKKGARQQYGDGTLLGFGPITRLEGLAPPPNPAQIAARRLGPLVAHMDGEHGLGGAES